jgi:WD40 repeat protein
MEAWHEQRKRLKGDFIWVRSLFPPRAPLGSEFVAKLTKHDHEVMSTAFDPASTRLASASRDRTIRISAVSDGSLLLETPFDKAGSIPQLTFSPNGQQLACLDDHGVLVLDARTGSSLVEFRTPEKTRAVAVWPGFRSVLVQSDDRLLICDITSGRILQETLIPSHLRQSKTVLCGDSRYVAFKTSDSVEVWDTKVSRQISSYAPHGPYKIAYITISEDALLAGVSESGPGGGHDHYVIWETSTGNVKHILKGQQTETTSMAFSPDGRYFVTSGWDLNARVWNTASGQCEKALGGHESPVVATTVDPASRLVACGCSLGELRMFRLGAEGQAKPRFIHNGHIAQTAFLKDGTFVSWGSNELKTWDAMTGQCIKEERFKQRPTFLEYMGYGLQPRRRVVGCESGQAEGTVFRVDGTSVPFAWFSEFVGFPTTQPDCRTWIGYRWDQVFLLRLEGELGFQLEQSEEA